MIKLIDGYWVDENNNKWSAEEEALELSKTLVNCKNCVNCKTLVNCKNCENCTNCVDCINCEYSKDCIDCINCVNCVECKKCQDCLKCQACDNCTNCIECEWCEGYINCRDCDDSVIYKMDFEKFHKEFEKYNKKGVNYSIEKIDDYNFKITIDDEVELKCSIYSGKHDGSVCIEDFGKLNEYLKKELNTDLLWSFYEKYLNYLECINEPLSVRELQNFINSLVWDIKRIKKYVSEKKEEDIKRILKTNKREFTLSGHLGLEIDIFDYSLYVDNSDEYLEKFRGNDGGEIIKYFEENELSQEDIYKFKNIVKDTLGNEMMYYLYDESVLGFHITDPFKANKLENMEKQLVEIINKFEKKINKLEEKKRKRGIHDKINRRMLGR